MPESIEHLGGLPKSFKFDKGGMPAITAAYVCTVKNTVDPNRMGRIQVYVEEFGATNPNDQSNWRTVQYLSPFYGLTPGPATNTDQFFTTNRQSYGMWFTPPDVGTRVLCLFVNGDPTLGYYLGCVPEQGLIHMLPAIGAGKKDVEYTTEPTELQDATQLPIIEINDKDPAIIGSGEFFKKPRPIHSYVALAMYQQGTYLDNERGPINSHAQRESPSRVFGMSTPGRPVYQGGYTDSDFLTKIDENPAPNQVNVIARQGGHTIVLDDGDVEGNNNLTRIRTSKGHQIMMHDSGDFIEIIHANGQTWIELGKEGTVDVFSTNSVNVRTQGTINLHADNDINMHAGGSINMFSKNNINTQSEAETNILAQAAFNLTGQSINQLSQNNLNLQSKSGSWSGGSSLNFVAGQIGLNSGGAATVSPVAPQTLKQFADVKHSAAGWEVVVNSIQSIVTRAPTHEPYPYHNLGVNVTSSI